MERGLQRHRGGCVSPSLGAGVTAGQGRGLVGFRQVQKAPAVRVERGVVQAHRGRGVRLVLDQVFRPIVIARTGALGGT